MNTNSSLRIMLFLLSVSFFAPNRTMAQEESMEYVGLKERAVLDIALMPDGSVVAATDQGLWKAGQGGKLLSPLPVSGLPRPIEGCFVHQVAANSQGDLYAAIGEVSAKGSTPGSDGVYRLSAGSGRWEAVQKTQLFEGLKWERVGSLSVFPDDTVFCSVNTKSAFKGESRPARLFRLRAGGKDWEVAGLDTSGGIHCGPVVPGIGTQVWAVVGEKAYYGAATWLMVADNWLAAPPAWKIKTIQPQNKPGAVMNEHPVSRVALDPAGVAYALVNAGKGEYPAGVYKSADGGANWRRVAETQRMYAVVITPENHIYYGSYGGIILSTNGGSTWTNFANIGKTFVSDLLIDHKGHLWASGDGQGELAPNYGLFRSKKPVSKGESPPKQP